MKIIFKALGRVEYWSDLLNGVQPALLIPGLHWDTGCTDSYRDILRPLPASVALLKD